MRYTAVCAERRECDFGPGGVKTILDDIDPDGAQIGGGEVVNGAIDLVERIFVVPGAAFRDQFFGFQKNPLIDFQELIAGDGVGVRIKIVEIAEQVFENLIAKLA